jgi:hypothetical protein
VQLRQWPTIPSCPHWSTTRQGWAVTDANAVTVALLTVPLLVIIILSFPVWLSWPWLKQERRTDVLNLVEKVTDALKAFVVESKDKEDDRKNRQK